MTRLLREAGEVLAQPWGGAARNHTVGALVWSAAEAAGTSADALVRGLAALSFGLGLFFLLPLPALDGGRMLLTLWEAARGRPVDARVQTLAPDAQPAGRRGGSGDGSRTARSARCSR